MNHHDLMLSDPDYARAFAAFCWTIPAEGRNEPEPAEDLPSK